MIYTEMTLDTYTRQAVPMRYVVATSQCDHYDNITGYMCIPLNFCIIITRELPETQREGRGSTA